MSAILFVPFSVLCGAIFMASFSTLPQMKSRLPSGVFCLLFCWIIGFFAGVFVSFIFVPSFSSLMHGLVLEPVSIVGNMICIFLPLALSVISIISCKPEIILLVCFVKAVSFGFCGMLVSSVFGSASWMIRLLLLFSDTVFITVLFWLWLRHFDRQIPCDFDCYVCLMVGILIAGIDYFVVGPVLQGLF